MFILAGSITALDLATISISSSFWPTLQSIVFSLPWAQSNITSYSGVLLETLTETSKHTFQNSYFLGFSRFAILVGQGSRNRGSRSAMLFIHYYLLNASNTFVTIMLQVSRVVSNVCQWHVLPFGAVALWLPLFSGFPKPNHSGVIQGTNISIQLVGGQERVLSGQRKQLPGSVRWHQVWPQTDVFVPLPFLSFLHNSSRQAAWTWGLGICPWNFLTKMILWQFEPNPT